MSGDLVIRDLLLADSTVFATVGNSIFVNDDVPQNQKAPYIHIKHVGGRDPWKTISGPSGVTEDQIDVNCYHKTNAGCRSLGADIQRALDGYRGEVNSNQVRGITLNDNAPFTDSSVHPKAYSWRYNFEIICDA
ncbi:MAG: DUF3168 domain-containing protein [Magnetococcales bacterium]|nr:DUF3168 domain-containing protein [Magnetococcales bacterium]